MMTSKIIMTMMPTTKNKKNTIGVVN